MVPARTTCTSGTTQTNTSDTSHGQNLPPAYFATVSPQVPDLNDVTQNSNHMYELKFGHVKGMAAEAKRQNIPPQELPKVIKKTKALADFQKGEFAFYYCRDPSQESYIFFLSLFNIENNTDSAEFKRGWEQGIRKVGFCVTPKAVVTP